MAKDDKPLSTELTMKTPEGQRASMENLPPPAVMQALYHSITGRKEKLSKDFDGNYVIKHSDVRSLIEKIEQTLQQFNFQAASANITIFHHKGEKLVLSSLEKFSQYDSSRGDPIKQLSVEIDFLLAVPQIGTHQGYKVTVDMLSYIVGADDYATSLGIGGGYSESDEYCIRSTIEYIDYVVARTFHSTIMEWVEGLEKTKVFSLTPRRGGWWRLEHFLGLVGGVATSYAVANIVSYIFPTIPIPVMVALVAGSALIGASIFEAAVEYAFERIGVRWYFPFIIINQGCERNYKLFQNRRERAAKIGWLVLGSGVIWIIANVFSKMLIKHLGY